ncbi:Calponin homology domain-containing protein [Phytophthora infestans]|uniref:Calponin homology domain-containing protein n=1 Tax=Phytophthora infestans TaxID=4787 RepID=A0A8S9TXI0_PHYIN|nr:Calponin homology domain-containing protein [Phytophthora infestans]
MEPLSGTGGRAVPQLHLPSATANPDSRNSNSAPNGGSVSDRLPHRSSRRQPETPTTSRMGKVMPARVSGASMEFLETPVLPPMQLRHVAATPNSSSSSCRQAQQATESDLNSGRKNNRDGVSEFQVLHPAIDELADEHGEDLARLLLSRWSIHLGEEQFASISLFCEMKLNEAKRMASWAEAPNRFYTVVCCQLLEKYISRIAVSKATHNNVDPVAATVGQSIAFLRRVHAELVASIFLPPTQTQAQDHAIKGGGLDYEHRTPYFTEFKRLRRKTQALVTTVRERESTRTTRQQLPGKVSKLIAHQTKRRDRETLALTFRGWANAMTAQRQIRALKIQGFQSMRRTNLIAWFRVWRIEALRRAYHQESADYQTMLSVTAASLSRKDIAIAEAEAKAKSMARIIDSLTESNKQLSYRVDHLENLSAAAAFTGGGDGEDDNHGINDNANGRHHDGDNGNFPLGRRREANYERMDTLLAQDDERMDRTNRMLLETMFGMARMVETSAIQMSKDMMDSLEYQLDGSVLQHLAEMIQTENELKVKADAADGSVSLSSLYFSKSIGGRTSTALTTMASRTTAAKPARYRAVTVRDLAQMPIDTLLLYWFRMHLSLSSSVEKPADRTVKNFTSDLADGRRLSFLLHRLFPSWFDASMVHELDVDQRLQNIATFHERVQPPLPQVVTSDSIHAASGTENVAFVAMLFGTAVGTVRKLNMEKQRGDFLNIVTTWRRVRGLLLEVKRMNDNYDAGMVAHLLKEMRTCETLFKQLHSELNQIAVTSNEASSALSQIAYKVLAITWSCVRARDILPNAPLGLVDERTHERIREFSRVDSACIRGLLVHDSENAFNLLNQSVGRKSSTTTNAGSVMPPFVPERDVGIATAAVRRALLAYSQDLNDIFKHYSASGGAGSLAAMSLTEFNKFIKDCFTGDKHITSQVADNIYRAALQLDTPATGGASALPTSSVTPATEVENGANEVTEGGPELSGRQFADALVRLAAIKYAPMPAPRGPRGGHTRAAPMPALPLDERFRLLMEQDILPNALRSQRELFRAEVAQPKVREVFQRHKPVLQRIFRYYASMHAIREQNSTLSLSAFIVMARDCKLIGSFVTEHTLKQVLVNLQRDDGNSSTMTTATISTEAELEMLRADFSDFQEALAALTEYVICNPYVSLHKRVDQFLQEMLLPRARQKKKSGE